MPRVHARDDNSPGPPARVAEDMLDAAICVDGGVQGLYAHIPFCAHRCHYCDFFTVAGRDDERSDFVSRLLAEADVVLKQLPAGIRTVFVGGGTPTHLPVQSLQELLLGLRQRLDAGGHQLEEWTIEANPDTVSAEVADALASAGVTRVSLGAQSFHEPALKMLERRHDPANVEQAMSRLRGVGITDLSLDLIFAVPELSDPLGVWARDLDAALSLDPKHLSCYGLTYEAGTPLRRRLDRGGVVRVAEEIEADLYELTRTRLASAGMEQYEISNWAHPGHRCLHNLLYWTNGNWWPLGPSASGHIKGRRWRNRPRLGAYVAGSGLSAIDSVEHLDEDGRAGEMLMLGLRLMEGVARERVTAACLTPARGEARKASIAQAIEDRLLQWADDRLSLTSEGVLLADSVIGQLL
ncbi:MAG: radical SAM family heme chaperone HemW [Planctomycetes bacterium]|nr:radical SAM family heme chaperone HemW [Planctomycetota bacterium]